jgi:site-specific DNA recombinase
MGGTPPTGYAKNERTLAIVAQEAEFVRHIFARYLEVGNVRNLADERAKQGTKGPVRIYASGRRAGGTP